MKDQSINRIAYIINQKPWIDNADVTMKDVTVTGIIPLQCELVNTLLHERVERFKKWNPITNQETDKFILDMMENYNADN